MKDSNNKEKIKLIINSDEIPLESNLGLLAYGDLAFSAWRKLKKQTKKVDSDEFQ